MLISRFYSLQDRTVPGAVGIVQQNVANLHKSPVLIYGRPLTDA